MWLLGPHFALEDVKFLFSSKKLVNVTASHFAVSLQHPSRALPWFPSGARFTSSGLHLVRVHGLPAGRTRKYLVANSAFWGSNLLNHDGMTKPRWLQIRDVLREMVIRESGQAGGQL